MKKTISIALAAMFIATTTPEMGCSPSSKSNPIPSVNLPDISNFTISAVSAFVKGASTLVSVASSTLADGTYTIFFDLGGANIISNASATLTMSGDNATFNTPALANDGNTTITIRKIVNSSGSTSTFTTAPTKTFSDSSGLMTYKVDGVQKRATHVNATWLTSGAMLSIHGVIWDPLTTFTIYWDNYTGTLSTRYFNSTVNVPGAWNSVYNGSATYSAPGASAFDAHGSITVTAKTATTITGTYSVVLEDSTQVTNGTFHCKLN
ncbi:MAG: Ig family protein [Flavipsychrobacter sp.]|jgi:hypothetical protein|nr:Ig family protein [Flavipsychrobacter sp.]